VPGHWLLGNLPELMKAVSVKGVATLMTKYHEVHGENVLILLPMQPPMIETTDPQVVEYILKTNFENWIKGSWFRERLSDLLGDGIFNVDGHKWKAQRKTASWMFSHNQFRNHIWRVVDRNCHKVRGLLRDVKPGETVDMFNVLNRFTLDTIGEVGFGKNIGSLENASSPFLKAFDRAQQIAVLRFMVPAWQLFRMFGIAHEADSRSTNKLLADYSKTVVQELQSNLNTEAGDSFVGIFMKEASKKGEPFDENFMKDMVLNFLIAGRDTTAQGLSWCLYLLMGHPEVEQKMLEEIREVCGDRELTYDELGRLKYVQAVIDESLRLYPSVPADSKVSVADDTLPDGTFVPAGCVIQFNPYAMGRSKKLWGEDAELFRPERWIGAEVPSAFKYTVFNAGPRECLGKRLAWVEMKAVLVGILRTVKLTLAVPRNEILPDVQLTIGMSSGLPCKVEAR
jgi:fatty acid omega-hydroxylase